MKMKATQLKKLRLFGENDEQIIYTDKNQDTFIFDKLTKEWIKSFIEHTEQGISIQQVKIEVIR